MVVTPESSVIFLCPRGSASFHRFLYLFQPLPLSIIFSLPKSIDFSLLSLSLSLSINNEIQNVVTERSFVKKNFCGSFCLWFLVISRRPFCMIFRLKCFMNDIKRSENCFCDWRLLDRNKFSSEFRCFLTEFLNLVRAIEFSRKFPLFHVVLWFNPVEKSLLEPMLI